MAGPDALSRLRGYSKNKKYVRIPENSADLRTSDPYCQAVLLYTWKGLVNALSPQPLWQGFLTSLHRDRVAGALSFVF